MVRSKKKASRRSQRRIVTEERLVACGLVAGTQMSWGSVIPALPAFSDDLAIGAFGLGAIVAVFGLGRMLTNIPAGILTRRLPSWPVLFVSSAAVLVLTVLTGLIETFEAALAVRFAAGLCSGFALTVGQHLVLSGAEPETRGRVSGFLQTVQFAGAALGPALGGAAMSLFGLFPAFVAASLGSAFFLLWAAVRWPHLGGEKKTDMPGSDITSEAEVLRARTLWLWAVTALYLTGFVIFAARFGGQQSLMPLIADDVAGVEAWQFGLGMTAITVISLLLAPWVGALNDRHDGRWLLAPSFAVSAALWGGIVLLDHKLAFLAVMVVAGTLMALPGGVPLASLVEKIPERQFGTAMGIYRTFGDFGTIVAPLLFGWLYDAGGPGWGVAGLGGLLLLGAAASLLIRRAPEASAPEVSPEAEPVGTEVTCADTDDPAGGTPQSMVLHQDRPAGVDSK